jgi:hypothetical protein
MSMSVFSEMAAREKAAAEARLAEAHAQVEKREADHLAARDRAQAALTKHVLPVLLEAKKAFEEDSVPCQVVEHFDLEPPQLTFQCVGDEIPVQSGGTLAARSVFLVVQASDSAEVRVSTTTAEDTFSAMIEKGRAPPDQLMDILAQVLPAILRSFYENLEIVHQQSRDT